MRKIYLVDIGLLVVAGTVAVVLTDNPVHPEASPIANTMSIEDTSSLSPDKKIEHSNESATGQ